MHDPRLRRIGAAFAAFNVAEWATWIAMLVYAYDHAGVLGSGVVAVVQLVPAAFFAPFASTLADRYTRERVLVASYVAQALAMGATAAAIAADAPLLPVYALAAVAATTVTITRPAQNGIVPSLATTPPQLTAANGALGAIENAGILVAPLIAGALLEIGGAALVYAAMALAVAAGGAVVATLRVAHVPRPGVRARLDPRTAFRSLAQDRGAASLVALLAAESVQIGAMDVLFVALALDVLRTGDAGVGILNAAMGLGGVIGAVAAARALGGRRLVRGVALGAVVWGGGIAAIALLRDAWTVAAMIALAGIGRSLADVAARTLLQRVARVDVLSGVFGVLEGLSMAALAIGSLFAPALVQLFDVRVALIGVGAVLPVTLALTGMSIARADATSDRETVPAVALLRPRHALADGVTDAAGDARRVADELVEEGPG
ncbi:MAG: MFS transporter [Chloroflexi bacterium]|nr:MAG: MFS transporter [Chloroflexota bacterium]